MNQKFCAALSHTEVGMQVGFRIDSFEQVDGWDERFGTFLDDLYLQEGLADTTIMKLRVQLTMFNRWLNNAYGRTWEKAHIGDPVREVLQVEGEDGHQPGNRQQVYVAFADRLEQELVERLALLQLISRRGLGRHRPENDRQQHDGAYQRRYRS